MLLLAKSTLAMMIGFVLAIIAGLILIPILRKFKIGQSVNEYLRDTHAKKNGTPTMGGFIFIIPTILTIVILQVLGKISISYNLIIVMLVFVLYALIGFADDYLIIKRRNNKGLTPTQKLIGQIVVALIFFAIFMYGKNEPVLWIHTLGIKVDLGFMYGFLILLYLVGFSNATNITDGLDGLCGGLSAISFISLGIITFNTTWLSGYEEIGIFCFVLVGSLLGFLIFNAKPAKVFMGDTGSLALGATMASIAILTRHELTLIIIAGVFVIELASSALQIFYYKLTKKRLFLMAPLHHHFEKLGWEEQDIVRLFYVVGLIFNMFAIAFGVWI